MENLKIYIFGTTLASSLTSHRNRCWEPRLWYFFFVFTKNVDFISLIKSDISQSSKHKCRKCPSMHMAHCPTWQEISRFQISASIFGQTNSAIRGAFFNYVDKILVFFDHLPTPGWHLWRNSFIVIKKNLHTVDISSTN